MIFVQNFINKELIEMTLIKKIYVYFIRKIFIIQFSTNLDSAKLVSFYLIFLSENTNGALTL